MLTEILFYQASHYSLEEILQKLLAKTLQSKQRVIVRLNDLDYLTFVDNFLWSFSGASFLPHNIMGDPNSSLSPVYLTTGEEVPNAANILILINATKLSLSTFSRFNRSCLLFSESNKQCVSEHKKLWELAISDGIPSKFWVQSKTGWKEKGKKVC